MNDAIGLKTDNGIESDSIRKILIVLSRSNSPVPLGYVSAHTAIKEPLGLLRKMEDMNLLCQCPRSSWSCCMGPMFELTPKAKKELFA